MKPRRRSRSHRRRGQGPSASKLLAYGLGIALCTGGLGYAALSAYGKPIPDALGCYAEAPQQQTLVFADASAPRWDEDQSRALRNRLDQLWHDLAFNERLSVYTTEGDVISSILKPRFTVCGQATHPEQLTEIGAQTATAGYLKKQKERLYERILAPELDALLTDEPDDHRRQRHQSPILESLQSISRDIQPKARLIAISDFIQNSETSQFCRVQNDLPSFTNFTKRPEYPLIKPRDFQGADVELLILQRAGYGLAGLEHCTGEGELLTFWQDYFTANGAAEVQITRIRQGFVSE